MKPLKFYLLFMIVLVNENTLKQSYAQLPEVRSPLSYAKTILDPVYEKAFKDDLGDKCFNLLYSHYKNGGNLFCNSLSQTAISLDYFTESPNIYLYHYTKSNIPYEIFKSNITLNEKLNEFFRFFRKRKQEKSSPYFASDSNSSQYFGSFLIKLKIKPDTKILLNKNIDAITRCSNEIEVNLNSFKKKCNISFFSSYERPDAQRLALMILEDSGIGLYDYFMGNFAKNHKTCKPILEESWLQLTGPEWVLDAESFDIQSSR